MRRLSLLSGFLFIVGCAPSAPPSTSPAPENARRDDRAVQEAAQAYLSLSLAQSPERMTLLGIHTGDTVLDDRRPSAHAYYDGLEDKMLGDLRRSLATPVASRTARTDLSIIESTLAIDLRWEQDRHPLETQPDLYLEPLYAFFGMTARDYAPAKTRALAVLARIEELPDILGSARANLKSPPRIWTEISIERTKEADAFFESLRPFMTTALPDRTRQVDASLALAKRVYADYGEFLAKEVLPRSTGTYAAGLPLFEYLMHERYMLTESAADIRALGQRVFDETDKEMLRVAKSIDPSAKTWAEVTARVKAKHPAASELRTSYAHEVARAKAFLIAHDVVPFPEGETCDVVDTPEFQRTTITAAYDEPPPFDAQKNGFFYVTPVDPKLPASEQEEMLRENDYADQVNTAVHETYPGHHLQLSFARAFPSLIRKMTGPAIFEEGWAFYCEELMNELGYYTPEERLLQLEWTLVRAARVLLDIGLHTQGMTVEDAVNFLTGRVHLEHALALSEVKRYTHDPTQPMAYLVGREKIFELRKRYKEREGAAYTLKRFHTELLSHGSIVPALLDQEIFGR
jgi:hypothetical protein